MYGSNTATLTNNFDLSHWIFHEHQRQEARDYLSSDMYSADGHAHSPEGFYNKRDTVHAVDP
jgi:hypothetical protein